MGLSIIFQKYRKRRSISLYIKQLRPTLTKLYGKDKYYKPEQVQRAIEVAKLPLGDLYYALAIYCTQTGFARYCAEKNNHLSYRKLRNEITEHFFHGDVDFTPQDVMDCIHNLGSHFQSWADSGSSVHNSDGGGHHGVH